MSKNSLLDQSIPTSVLLESPPPSNAATCPRCAVQLMVKEKDKMLSASGILWAVVFVLGMGTLLVDPIIGFIMILASVLFGITSRSKKQVLVCPACGEEIRELGT